MLNELLVRVSRVVGYLVPLVLLLLLAGSTMYLNAVGGLCLTMILLDSAFFTIKQDYRLNLFVKINWVVLGAAIFSLAMVTMFGVVTFAVVSEILMLLVIAMPIATFFADLFESITDEMLHT